MNNETKIQLPMRIRNFPKVMSDLIFTNNYLKTFAMAFFLLSLALIVVLQTQLSEDPLVITLSPNGNTLDRVEKPKAQDEIITAIKYYLEFRYNWNPKEVTTNLRWSERFIEKNSLKAFQDAVANVAKFSTEKQVSQKVYPNKFDVNLENNTIVILGDRITEIQGLKAAGNLKLELTFESGKRTYDNPWGIYITKEREE